MRHHPLTILFRVYQVVKNTIFIVFILFILRKDSEFWLFSYGRYAYLIFLALGIAHIIGSWFKETYTLENDASFTMKKGLFVTKISTIPFSKIQNVTQKISFLHKLFGVTSLRFETAMTGEGNHVTFEVVSKKQAAKLTAMIEQQQEHEQAYAEEETDVGERQSETETEVKAQPEVQQNRTVHFIPTKKELWKASFTSLSFLAIIPIAGSLYDDFAPFLPDIQLFTGAGSIFILIVVGVLLAVSFGVVRTFTRYGNYEISSSDTHIFIHRGMLNESYFRIEKKKVQGFEIKQSPLKRLLRLAEVKLISSSGFVNTEDAVQVNSLYPFLPVTQAVKLIEQLMPGYSIHNDMQRLPKISLWVKLVRPSWVWLIATALLFYFMPTPYEHAWWIASILLFILVVVNRILDYRHTKYCIQGDQVQWWHGGLMSQMFVTKRSKLIEVEYSQSLLQKKLQLVTIKTKNRSAPVRVDGIKDVPIAFRSAFDKWYRERTADVTMES